MYSEIFKCRICGNDKLVELLDIGVHALTGVFPRTKDELITTGPLVLVKCDESDSKSCGLVQLKHNFSLSEMYGMNYGYRSSLNSSMVDHLRQKVERVEKLTILSEGDIILDIGSNDCTLLKSYSNRSLNFIGIDPTGEKFREYYPEEVKLIPDFFSAKNFSKVFGEKKAKVVTSIAMFYDLEAPQDFVNEVASILDTDGIWVFEQSYLPSMIDTMSYDTICHEHLEFYALKQIKWMADRAGLKIIDVEFNKVNGGSFSITVARNESSFPENTELITQILNKEINDGYETLRPLQKFADEVDETKAELLALLNKLKDQGKTVLGYGASTKGNVTLQYCAITSDLIPVIADVNPDKFGKMTPETHIPIVSEEDASKLNPDYYLVLPWHFRDNILSRETAYMDAGGKFIFPFPVLEIV
jgi:hypothetical protein